MSDINDLIHTNALSAFRQGESRERDRILKLLAPFAEHTESCADGCYPEDCDAGSVQYLINKILETGLQQNVNNTGQKGE
jgi:hypothetical protein